MAVFHQGRWFKLYCYAKGKQVKPKLLEKALEAILNDESIPSKGEEHLGALTAGDRVPWAEVSCKCEFLMLEFSCTYLCMTYEAKRFLLVFISCLQILTELY